MLGIKYKDLLDLNDLRTLRFVNNPESIVFLVKSGVGKTHLAIALGILAVEHKYSMYFFNCHSLIQNLLKPVRKIG